MAKRRQRKKRQPLVYQDFQAVTKLPDQLAELLRRICHITPSEWNLALDKLARNHAYFEEAQSKGPGRGYRYLHKPCRELKAIQTKILHHFLYLLPTHWTMHGNQKGSSIVTNALAHRGHQHLFSIDIIDAFPSILRSRIRTNLRKALLYQLAFQFPDIELTWENQKLLTEALVDLVCYHDRLPQGPPSSPRIQDICFTAMAKDLEKLVRDSSTPFQQYQLTFWADNIYLSAPHEIPEPLRLAVLETIKQHGFRPHERTDKTTYYSPSTGLVPVVSGFVLLPDGRLNYTPHKVNKLRGRLHRLLQETAWTPHDMAVASGTIGILRYVYEKQELPAKLRHVLPGAETRIAIEKAKRAAERVTQATGVMPTSPYVLFTDGAARLGPGRTIGAAAIGAVLLRNGKDLGTLSAPIGTATNNQAEYQALIAGLELAKKEGITELDCYLDAETVVRQLTRQFKVTSANIRPFFLRVLDLAAEIGDVRFHHISREQNTRADALANAALDRVSAPLSPPKTT